MTSSSDLVVVMGVGTKTKRGGCDAVFWTSSDLDEWTTTDDSANERRGRCGHARRWSFLAFGTECNENGAFPLAYHKEPGGDWEPLQFNESKKGTVLAAAPKGRDGFVMVGTEGVHGTAWWS